MYFIAGSRQERLPEQEISSRPQYSSHPQEEQTLVVNPQTRTKDLANLNTNLQKWVSLKRGLSVASAAALEKLAACGSCKNRRELSKFSRLNCERRVAAAAPRWDMNLNKHNTNITMKDDWKSLSRASRKAIVSLGIIAPNFENAVWVHLKGCQWKANVV